MAKENSFDVEDEISELMIYSRKAYYTWMNMKQRCYNVKLKNYHHYGGRGIKVCPEWMNFDNFAEDCFKKENAFEKGYSIDRIDNDGDYSNENVKFSTVKEQANNKRNNVK